MGTPSLLLTLLKDEVGRSSDSKINENIRTVVDALEAKDSNQQRSLAKDIAQKALYDALYAIIEKEGRYSNANMAIGMALECAIKGASPTDLATQTLRATLRDAIRAALTPK
jgi:hypothetical protein